MITKGNFSRTLSNMFNSYTKLADTIQDLLIFGLHFKIEIDKITTPNYLDHEQKLSCIIYSVNLIKILKK